MPPSCSILGSLAGGGEVWRVIRGGPEFTGHQGAMAQPSLNIGAPIKLRCQLTQIQAPFWVASSPGAPMTATPLAPMTASGALDRDGSQTARGHL